MRIPYAPCVKEIEVLSSRFIACLYPLDSAEEVDLFLAKTKELYPKARHYPYAFRLLPLEGASDAGEPKGSTGIPLLETLRREEVDRVLVVVVRYFGGTKLGLPRLTRTYRDAASLALMAMEEGVLLDEREVRLETTYALAARLKGEALRKGLMVQKEEYGLSVALSVIGSAKMVEAFLEPYLKEITVLKDECVQRRMRKDDSSE